MDISGMEVITAGGGASLIGIGLWFLGQMINKAKPPKDVQESYESSLAWHTSELRKAQRDIGELRDLLSTQSQELHAATKRSRQLEDLIEEIVKKWPETADFIRRRLKEHSV